MLEVFLGIDIPGQPLKTGTLDLQAAGKHLQVGRRAARRVDHQCAGKRHQGLEPGAAEVVLERELEPGNAAMPQPRRAARARATYPAPRGAARASRGCRRAAGPRVEHETGPHRQIGGALRQQLAGLVEQGAHQHLVEEAAGAGGVDAYLARCRVVKRKGIAKQGPITAEHLAARQYRGFAFGLRFARAALSGPCSRLG